MIDPLTAISLASSIVQLLDCGSKLVVKGYRIYRSAEGTTTENLETGRVVADLQSFSEGIKHSSSAISSSTKDEEALLQLASKCTILADDLLRMIENLKVPKEGRGKYIPSVEQLTKIFKTMRREDDIRQIRAKLTTYREQMNSRLLSIIR